MDHYKDTQHFFDNVATQKGGFFDAVGSIPYYFQSRIREKVLAWSRPLKPGKILDAGCGMGDFSQIVSEYFLGSRVSGVDFSEKTVQLAKELYGKNEQLDFSRASLLDLPFNDRAFDLVFCIGTFHHIAKADQPIFVKELTRVAKDTVIIEFRHDRNIFWPLYQFLFKRSNPGIDCYGIGMKEANSLLAARGFIRKKQFAIFGPLVFSPLVLCEFKRK